MLLLFRTIFKKAHLKSRICGYAAYGAATFKMYGGRDTCMCSFKAGANGKVHDSLR